MTTPLNEHFHFPPRWKFTLTMIVVLGTVCFGIGLKVDAQRAWADFLLNYALWTWIALSGAFFVALQYITGSRWSAALRRVPECFLAFLPAALVLFVVLCFGIHFLYEWSHADVVAQHHLLQEKSVYLNTPFFIIRTLVLLGVTLGIGGWMTNNSLKQDRTGNPALSKLNTTISALFLIFFGWAFSFHAFDLIMSLSPEWFSTIFGVYCWADLFVGGVAMVTIIVITLKKLGYLKGIVTADHYHDLGKLLFAFSVFWAYVAFSQYMLIWYANLPEETPYMIARLTPTWEPVSILLMIVKFGVPFFLLIGRWAKRNENVLLFAAVWLLLAQWLDLYWMVFPTFFDAPVFGWMEVGIFAGFGALFLLCIGNFLAAVPLVALKDPGLHESMHYHQ